MKDTLAIVGSHPGTRSEFDFERRDCDVWVFNEAATAAWCKRADAVFQMHLPAVWRNPENRNDKNHYSWLTSGDTPPVYMLEAYTEVPRSVRYPIEEVQRELLGNFNWPKYFTSSVCFAIALGIYLRYRRIEIYGVEMETGTEYTAQRPGVAFWIGLAVGRGIVVEAHCGIFDEPLYGYEGAVTIAYDDFVRRVAELTPQCQQAQQQYEAARQSTQAALQRMVQKQAISDTELTKLIQQQVALASNFGYLDGKRQENERYQKKAEAMIAAAGNYVIVRQEFEQAMNALVKERETALLAANALAGQLQEALSRVTETNNPKKRLSRMNHAVEILKRFVEESVKTGMYTGAAEENHELMRRLDSLVRAAGGSKSEEVLVREAQLADMG